MVSSAATAELDPRVCEQARLTRDARFDGLFYTAVRTTGIYCRPVCPAPAPKARNVSYFASAAAAAAAGYRPCLRCRPEAAPGASAHRASSELVACALRLIEDGALDRAPLAALAARIGVGERHLRRLFAQQLGASPLDVAATRRLLFAKRLITETALPVTEAALASGYASVRRFNSAFAATYGMAPRALRRSRSALAGNGDITLRLGYRPPYDFPALLAFFARRALPGLETVDANSYQRGFALDGAPGWFSVSALPNEPALLLRVRHGRSTALLDLVGRVRRMFDLDADMTTIGTCLACDPLLAPLLRDAPGLRVPGGWDGFEIAVRAVLGQQVSVAAARTFAQRLVERFGTRVDGATDGASQWLFPPATTLAAADLGAIGLTRTRAATLRAIAVAVAEGRVHFRPEQTLDDFVRNWTELPGVGAWTAHYIAMRALGHPDAFPAADLILRKAVGNGTPLSTTLLEQRSQAWRPWRAYAVLHLWRSMN